MNRPGGRQRGFTLLELLVVIPISALVVAAATGVIIQLLRTNDVNASTYVTRQVQTAGGWVSRDGLQALSTSGIGTTGPGMPFTLTYSFWDTEAEPPVNETHQVTYSLVNMPSGTLQQLERHEIITNAVGVVTSDTTIIVARNIDGAATTCRWEPDAGEPSGYSQTTFVFTVRSLMGGKEEVRSYQIRPRTGS
ncbi:MAG: prepilin-type N-terminal cleavage/methylation domain-containing protein [Chloroflexi bacterium]|nr:prepilin-type N-terminal cleavage/methylation domain-containing protein [Chloroflexota bacterium]